MTKREGPDHLPVDALLGLNLQPRGPSYTLVQLLAGMVAPSMPVSVYSPLNRWPVALPFPVHTGRGATLSTRLRVPYRVMGSHLRRSAEMRLLNKVGRSVNESLVFTWGEISLETSERLSSIGQRVVREKFNCAKKTSSAILEDAYGRLGVPGSPIPAAMIEKEQHELSLADAIFCPSPMVRASLIHIGIEPDRLLDTTYGWDPARFPHVADPVARQDDGPSLLFVGTVCVRKGAHLLLEAWRNAKIKGRLVLVGGMEPLIAKRYASILAQEDVLYVPYTDDIAAFYRAADWFVFPSLEEGGPQVTYEAAGNGLPLLVSPMGAGAFARDGMDGRVITGMDTAAWTDAIRELPDLVSRREHLAVNARLHADEFTYDKVGARRRDLLLKKFAPASPVNQ